MNERRQIQRSCRLEPRGLIEHWYLLLQVQSVPAPRVAREGEAHAALTLLYISPGVERSTVRAAIQRPATRECRQSTKRPTIFPVYYNDCCATVQHC